MFKIPKHCKTTHARKCVCTAEEAQEYVDDMSAYLAKIFREWPKR